jgi:hypothetical protein
MDEEQKEVEAALDQIMQPRSEKMSVFGTGYEWARFVALRVSAGMSDVHHVHGPAAHAAGYKTVL